MAILVWPVPGFRRVSSGFRTAERPGHNGIDIGRNLAPPAPILGAGVVAAAAGRVARAGELHDSMGNWLELDHGGGLVTRYMHCLAVLVGAGARVGQGDVVALVGSTGRSTGPHLHFEVLRGGRHLDPAGFFGA